jgi:hypothetical protein
MDPRIRIADGQDITDEELTELRQMALLAPGPVNTVAADRVTALLSFHHERHGRPPHTIEARWSEELKNKQQSYYREMEVGEAMSPLGFEWLHDCVGYFIVHNRTDQNPLVQRSSKEKAETELKWVIVSPAGCRKGVICRPGRVIMVDAEPGTTYVIRSNYGQADVSLNAFPR